MPAGDIHLETEFEKYVARKLTNLTQLDGVKWVKSDNDKVLTRGLRWCSTTSSSTSVVSTLKS